MGLRARARCLEMLASGCRSAAAKFELTECRGVERVGSEPVATVNPLDFFEPAHGPLVLGDRYGAIEGYDRRWTQPD